MTTSTPISAPAERLCVVMPVYNERDAIGPVLEKWHRALSALGIDFAVRPYNDGSKDDSLAVMRATAARLGPRIDVRDKPNGGHGHTILTAYRDAARDGFDWIFQIDSDDEMGPERFADLWNARRDCDFLLGRRDGRVQALPRKVVSGVSRLCVRIFYGQSVWDVNSPYRLMRTSAFADLFREIPATTFAPNVIISGMAARRGLRCFEMPVPQHDRTTGEVSIKKWRLLKAAAKSFAQTIAFPFTDAFRSRSWFDYAPLLSILAALAFTIFLGATPRRLLGIAVVLLAVWAARAIPSFRTGISKTASWMAAHWKTALALILLFGTFLRIGYAVFQSDLVDQSRWQTDVFDYPILWNYAIEYAHGNFVECKSWGTALFYAIPVRLFGENLTAAYAATTLLHAATAILAFLFLSGIAGRLAGLFAAAFFYWAPAFVGHSANVASEHPYVFILMLLLLAVTRALHSRSAPAATLWTALAGLLCWAAVWTRGEGIALWVAVPLWLAVGAFAAGRGFKRAILYLAVSVLVFVSGASFAARINQKALGVPLMFCSTDNYWPRLFGSNVKTGGQYAPQDKDLIYAHLEPDPTRLHYEWRHGGCPPECIPYIQEEIHRRWKGMPLRTMIPFVWTKERFSWCHDKPPWDGKTTVSKALAHTIAISFPSLWLVFGAVFSLHLLRKWQNRQSLLREFPLLLAPVILSLNFAILALAESSPRYGYSFYVFWALLASPGMVLFQSRHSSRTLP